MAMGISASDALLEGPATVGFAQLRFATAACHRYIARSSAPGHGSLGVEAFLFLPVAKRVKRAAAPYLASCPSPALLLPTSTAGVIALILSSELERDRPQWAEHALDDCRAGLHSSMRPLGLTPEAA